MPIWPKKPPRTLRAECRPKKRRRQARIKFGNPQRVRESLWQQNTIHSL